MLPLYENIEDNLEIYTGKASHIPPHLHDATEKVVSLVSQGVKYV